MAELPGDKRVFSLSDVTRSIHKTLSERYGSAFWVRAEMNKLNHYARSGHCFPDLLERQDGKVLAQMRAYIMKDDYRRINDTFLKTLGEPLKDGIKILFLARITFDSVRGLSLWILDMDPTFTLGDLEKEKQETIRRLKEEGLFEKNKSLPFPLLPQRLAIISVETSKGYADFMNIVRESAYSGVIFQKLFPALLQGERAVRDITLRLNEIRKLRSRFDAVVILRGGGGEAGLSAYNHYDLARAVAAFPLPVLTGIGHATNETVTEMVACHKGITPTEVAEFIVGRFKSYDEALRQAADVIRVKTKMLVRNQKAHLEHQNRLLGTLVQAQMAAARRDYSQYAQNVRHHARLLLTEHQQGIRFWDDSLRRAAGNCLRFHFQNLGRLSFTLAPQIGHRLELWNQQWQRQSTALNLLTHHALRMHRTTLYGVEKQVQLLSPENVLRRGYSITLHNGKALKSSQNVQTGDLLITLLAEGVLESHVSDIKNSSSK